MRRFRPAAIGFAAAAALALLGQPVPAAAILALTVTSFGLRRWAHRLLPRALRFTDPFDQWIATSALTALAGAVSLAVLGILILAGVVDAHPFYGVLGFVGSALGFTGAVKMLRHLGPSAADSDGDRRSF